MKSSLLQRMALALVGGICVGAVTTAVAAPKVVNLYAKLVYLNPTTGATAATPDPGLVPMWGFASTPDGLASVPGPRIDVGPTEYADGLQITVYNLLTNLPTAEPVSLVIPGLNGSINVGAPARFGAADGVLANRVRSFVNEVPVNESRTYGWTGPLNPGTYAYHSGSHPALQVQMGLCGMVTVQQAVGQVYPGVFPASEVPLVFTEIDPGLHWAVHTNDYGPGKGVPSTIHSDPSYFLINGQAYDPALPPAPLEAAGQVGTSTLFRMVNFCWDTRIPVVGGPYPSAEGSYLSIIAEDGQPYTYPKVLYAPDLPALKTKDALFMPTSEGSYRVYDRRLGLANGTESVGGMLRRWEVAPGVVLPPTPLLGVNPLNLNFAAFAGGANPAGQAINIVNGGSGTLNWTATVNPGAAWLGAAPGSGVDAGTVTASVNLAGLPAGSYSGSLLIEAPGATASPQTVNVTLVVNPPAPVSIVGIERFSTQSPAVGANTHALTAVPAGALLVLTSQGGTLSSANAAVSSSPALTWTKRADAAGSTTSGSAEIWTARFTAGGNLSVSSSWGALIRQSSVCYVVTNSEATPGGAAAVATAQAAPSVSVTSTRANSLLFCVSSDLNGQNGTTRAYRDAATEALYYRPAVLLGPTTGYHYYKRATAVGAYTEGLTAPSGQRAGSCVLEVRSP